MILLTIGFLFGVSLGMVIGFYQRKTAKESYEKSYEKSVNLMADKYYKALYEKKLKEISEQ